MSGGGKNVRRAAEDGAAAEKEIFFSLARVARTWLLVLITLEFGARMGLFGAKALPWRPVYTILPTVDRSMHFD